MTKLTTKQQRFIEEYTVDWNATQAAIRAGYSKKTASETGYENLRKPQIAEAIAERVRAKTLTADQLLKMQSEIATLDISKYMVSYGATAAIDVEAMIADGQGHHIKGIKYTAKGGAMIEFYDKQRAQEKLLSHLEPDKGTEDNPFIINVVRVNRGNSD